MKCEDEEKLFELLFGVSSFLYILQIEMPKAKPYKSCAE